MEVPEGADVGFMDVVFRAIYFHAGDLGAGADANGREPELVGYRKEE